MAKWSKPYSEFITNRFQCVISQKKEEQILLKFIIYNFWVEVIPWELLSNEFTVQFLFLLTVYGLMALSWGGRVTRCLVFKAFIFNIHHNGITDILITLYYNIYILLSYMPRNNLKIFVQLRSILQMLPPVLWNAFPVINAMIKMCSF